MAIKVLNNMGDLNIILDLPKEEIIVDAIDYNVKEIRFDKRISKLYMDSIGFVPHNKNGRYYTYTSNYNNNFISVQSRTVIDRNSSSIGRDIDITNKDIVSLDNLLNGFKFIIAEKNTNLLLKKFEIVKVEEDKFEIKFLEYLSHRISDNSLERTGFITHINEVKDFFEEVDFIDLLFIDYMEELCFNKFSKEKGFFDIHRKYKRILNPNFFENFYNNESYNLQAYDYFKYLYYEYELDFYYLSEHLIKNNMEEKIYSFNPSISDKKIPKINEITMLSKLSRDIMNKHRFNKENDILFLMESDKKIGRDGIKVIYEYIELMDGIIRKRNNHSWSNSFYTGNVERVFKLIYKVINSFDITPKILMNRLVKFIFNDNLSLFNSLNMIVDTIEMAKELEVDLGTKMPSNILKLHDTLSEQVRYIENEIIERAFNERIKVNIKLLNKVPLSSEFTILSPEIPNDLINEGLKLNHCVGSYIYRYVSGYSRIFFIRTKSNESQPFVTVELDNNNELIQLKGFSNKTPSKDVVDFVLSWVKNLSVEV